MENQKEQEKKKQQQQQTQEQAQTQEQEQTQTQEQEQTQTQTQTQEQAQTQAQEQAPQIVSNQTEVKQSHGLRSFASSTSLTSYTTQDSRNVSNFEADALVNGTFTKISLDSFKGKYVCLLFFPRDFSTFQSELFSFNSNKPRFSELNCEVLVCNADSKYAHFAWINMEQKQEPSLQFDLPLISDLNYKISNQFGFDENSCNRGLFVISQEGEIIHFTLLSHGGVLDPEEPLRVLSSRQQSSN